MNNFFLNCDFVLILFLVSYFVRTVETFHNFDTFRNDSINKLLGNFKVYFEIHQLLKYI